MYFFMLINVIALFIELCEEDTVITEDDDGTDAESRDSNDVNMECANTNRLTVSKVDTDTFIHVDKIITVTLTLHLSSCKHVDPDGNIQTQESQNAYITHDNNTYTTSYTYKHY